MSNLSIGIVGLPNVGKSTLFNALTKISVPAENYPFCTIDPNIGVVQVSDSRLDELAKIVNPEKITPAVIKFYDIAGLVKGASKGEGLGNQFLASIREVDAIVHLVRFFENDQIIHVHNKIDPKYDVEIIETELALKDLEVVNKRFISLAKQLRASVGKEKEQAERENALLNRVKVALEDGACARDLDYTDDEKEILSGLALLTYKPVIYLFNTTDMSADLSEMKKLAGIGDNEIAIKMDVKIEGELASMSDEDRALFMEEFGIKETGLSILSRTCYSALNLISFLTAGEKEVRAWTITKGATAPEAAGKIHTDFQDKFICVEAVDYDKFILAGGWAGSKEKGFVRLEGKDYVVNDGDVVLFRFGA